MLKYRNTMAAMLAVVLSGSFPAWAQAVSDSQSASALHVGNASLVEGEAGSVLVQRDGVTYSLGTGDPIFQGDRISTSGAGRVVLETAGCQRTVEPMSMMVLAADLCATPITQVSSPTVLGTGTISTPVVAAAGAGVLGIFVATRENDDGGEEPISR